MTESCRQFDPIADTERWSRSETAAMVAASCRQFDPIADTESDGFRDVASSMIELQTIRSDCGY